MIIKGEKIPSSSHGDKMNSMIRKTDCEGPQVPSQKVDYHFVDSRKPWNILSRGLYVQSSVRGSLICEIGRRNTGQPEGEVGNSIKPWIQGSAFHD